MCVAVLRYEHPRESWMKRHTRHKDVQLPEEGIYKTQHAKPTTAQPGQKKIPELNQVKVRDTRTQQVHPDHDHKNEEFELSTNTECNTKLFSSQQLQSSSEDAMNAIT